MRCYRVRGKGVRGLYQKATVQSNGEKPPHLSLLEASSLCWLQLWYTVIHTVQTQPGAPQPREADLENPTFSQLSLTVFPSITLHGTRSGHFCTWPLSVSSCETERFWCALLHSKLISWLQITLLLCWSPKLILSSQLKESTCVGLRHWAHSCQKVWQDVLACQEISVRL